MKLPDFLTEWPFGEIVLTGHRIGLYHVIWYRNAGHTAQMLHQEFPSLPLDLIEKVLVFAQENQKEVDAYVSRCQEEIDEQRRTGLHVDLEELKRRWIATGRTWNG
jgi:uncharacterized protein (DUF433 family)